MRPRKTTVAIALPLAVALSCSASYADVNLQITEMWPGGLPGVDTTSDWFEINNFGDEAAVNLDGNLYYDDNSDNPETADPMIEIDTIAPGESVIYLVSWENKYDNDLAAALAAFYAMWGPLDGVQVSTVAFGGGLGGQGDAVNIFDGNTAEAITIDREEYVGPTSELSFVSNADGIWEPRLAQVGVLGAYLGNLSADDQGAPPAVGSPGVVVPEPGTVALVVAGLCGLLFVSFRKRS